MTDELWQASASELAEGIARRSSRVVEVMASVVERIQAKNRALNAIVIDLTDQALAEATAADRALAVASSRVRSSACRRRSRLTWTRRASDDQRVARARQPDRPRGCAAGAQSEDGWRHHRRPHQHAGSLDARDDGEPAARPYVQSMAPGRLARRLVRRRRRRRRGRVRPYPSRQRHRRVAPVSRVRERRGDDQIDAGPCARVQPVGDRRAWARRDAHVRAGRDRRALLRTSAWPLA